MSKSPASLATGLLFAIFWSSASVAGKFGLQSVEPLVLFTVRFFGAGLVLLAYVHGIEQSRLPQGREWKELTIFGAFNTAIYLGVFVFALQQVTPGITTLALALNPLFISILSSLWMKRRVNVYEWLCIALGIAGVAVAAYPLLLHSHATPLGLVLLAISMVAYSFGSVYYSSVRWSLSRTAINAWQVFIAGILVLPFMFLFHARENHFDLRFWCSLLWLIFPVSILAVQLWLRLLRADAVRASLWLYICPIFGFLYAYMLLDEPVSVFTGAGTVLVMTSLYLGQKK
jgi:drug/metabolite transporter (DMT)-like permease